MSKASEMVQQLLTRPAGEEVTGAEQALTSADPLFTWVTFDDPDVAAAFVLRMRARGRTTTEAFLDGMIPPEFGTFRRVGVVLLQEKEWVSYSFGEDGLDNYEELLDPLIDDVYNEVYEQAEKKE